MNREITKKELLLAVAMSTYNQTTHVHYIPPGTHYTAMLRKMRSQNFVKPIGESFYTLTMKGWNYLKTRDIKHFQDIDKAINEFVDNL